MMKTLMYLHNIYYGAIITKNNYNNLIHNKVHLTSKQVIQYQCLIEQEYTAKIEYYRENLNLYGDDLSKID